ncbi:hypothetical protein MCOR02_000836 [Pyricularia oryzae]|nr:hypothetical protein MCOR02_000836 [Pyricularia oryzae]KAI6269112.1 hypothetical protein MCOR26_008877 [Pyricularia oryzae]KAI6622610.1 hypothetical protein MCOR14_009722 [Pyricularia oryzae]
MKLSILATILLASSGVNAANGFASSCSNVALSGLILRGRCDEPGRFGVTPRQDTKLDVSKCFSLDGEGKISCKKGDIGACKCQLATNKSMTCNCNNSKGAKVQSDVDLEKAVQWPYQADLTLVVDPASLLRMRRFHTTIDPNRSYQVTYRKTLPNGGKATDAFGGRIDGRPICKVEWICPDLIEGCFEGGAIFKNA